MTSTRPTWRDWAPSSGRCSRRSRPGWARGGRPTLWRQGLLLRHLRKLDTRGAVDVTRLLTGSIADLIDR